MTSNRNNLLCMITHRHEPGIVPTVKHLLRMCNYKALSSSESVQVLQIEKK